MTTTKGDNMENRRKVRRTLHTIRKMEGVTYRLLIPSTGEIFESDDLASLYQRASEAYSYAGRVGYPFDFRLETK